MNIIASIEFFIPYLIVVGYVASHTASQYQIIFKIEGAKSSSIATGYNYAMKVMIIASLGIIVFNISSSWLIEKFISTQDFLKIVISAIMICSVGSFWIVIKFFSKIEIKELYRNHKKIFSLALLANSFAVVGQTLPLTLGTIFFENRLFLANTSFIFNAFYTLIEVFYIESILARKIDSGSHDIDYFASAVIYSRLAAFVIVSVCYFILFRIV